MPQTSIRFLAPNSPAQPGAFVRLRPPGQPVLVSVHGISRNAAEHALRLAAAPELADCTIIAPLFEAGHFGRYQQLHPGGPGGRANEALLRLLDRLEHDGLISSGRLMLTGYSGGAQFAHRFAAFHPDRVERVAPVAAGWYLWPDQALAWPLGTGALPSGMPAARLEALLRLPIDVICGSRDRRGGEMRNTPEIDALQGRTRIGRARRWVAAMQALAQRLGLPPQVRLHELDGAGHDFGAAVERFGLAGLLAQCLLDRPALREVA